MLCVCVGLCLWCAKIGGVVDEVCGVCVCVCVCVCVLKEEQCWMRFVCVCVCLADPVESGACVCVCGSVCGVVVRVTSRGCVWCGVCVCVCVSSCPSPDWSLCVCVCVCDRWLPHV